MKNKRKIESYLNELEAVHLRKIKRTGQTTSEAHNAAIDIVKIVVRIRELLDEQE